jgi:hypothetical protein
MRRAYILLCLLFAFVVKINFGQQSQLIDSLNAVLKTQKEDTNKVKNLITLCWQTSRSDIESSTK